MNKTVLITGATAGIGKATALLLAKQNFRLIITGRRGELLQSVVKDIKNLGEIDVLPLVFDVRDKRTVFDTIKNLPENWKQIDVLVNNAGLASGLDPIHEGKIDDWETMIDTNIKGLLYVSKAVLPGMVERGNGHIVNVGSVAGKEVYEKGNVYCGTKHAVEGISKGMRIDLLKHNIKVTNIAPGMVETEFSIVRFYGDKDKADKVYENWIPLYAEDIAEAIVFAITRPPHVNINDILIMATDQANVVYLNRKENQK